MSKGYNVNKIENYLRDIFVDGLVSANQDLDIANKWSEFLNSLEKTNNPYKNSKNKYRARMYYVGYKYIFLSNFNAFFKLINIYTKNLLEKIFKANYKTSKGYMAEDAGDLDMVVQERDDMPLYDIFPEELYKEFPNYVKVPVEFTRTHILNKELKRTYRKLCRKNILSFNYKLMALKELALHSYIVENYNPKAVIVYANERNLFSPILKEYYENNNKEFISFMHGTDLLHLIKAFTAFSRYYVWDNGYIEMYKDDLYFDVNQYIKYTPIKNSYSFKEKDKYLKDITYYISGHTDDAHRRIAKLIKILFNKGIKLIVRPHPRRKFNQSIYNKEDLEDLNINIEESIDNSEYILGVASTVIEQAYYGGKKIILDDVTNREEFKTLEVRKFLMLSKLGDDKIILLSEYLRKIGINIDEIDLT